MSNPETTIPEWLSEVVHPVADYEDGRLVVEGTLTSLNGRYVTWVAGEASIVLDGHFTAQELREIADMMEAMRRE